MIEKPTYNLIYKSQILVRDDLYIEIITIRCKISYKLD